MPPEKENLVLAVVSLGSIGRRHLRNLRALEPEARLIACRLRGAAPLPPEISALADEVVTGLDAALSLRPDGAVVCSPASTHLEAGLALARAGAHLFMEKPLAVSAEGVRALLDECSRRSLTLMVGYNLRFHPPLLALKEALDQGRIGRLLYLRAEAGQFLPQWRPGSDYRQGVSARRELGGGALLELSHELDLARWLGGEVAALSARVARVGDLEIDVEDLAEVVLTFRNGALGSVHLDMLAQPGLRGCRLVGSAGVLAWDNQGGPPRCHDVAGEAWQDLLPDEMEIDPNQMYLDEMRHFLERLRAGGRPSPDGEDGLAVLRLVEAALLAGQQGKEVAL